MRIGVVSDSHGYTGRLSTLLMAMEAEGPLDALFHLGDGYSDLQELGVPLPKIYQVAGNCDWGRTDTLEAVCLSGARIILTHGHMQGAKRSTDGLMGLALAEKAHAVLFGHTHRPLCRWENGILLLNPGAAMDGRYAILTINRLGAIDAKLYGD